MQKRQAKERILIVDDSEMNRSILADMLSDEFETEEAEDGEAALAVLAGGADRFSLVLLDIVMPKADGFAVLAEMKKRGMMEDLPVIMVSSETASEQIERAYELGATDFIMRPFDASIVHRRVLNTIFLYAKQRKLVGIIEEQIREKEQNSSDMVDILSHIVEFRNGESGLHIRHVRALTAFLLRRLIKKTDRYPVSEQDIPVISMASALHDIGKIGIDDKILNKPGKLTEEEYGVMKTHSMIGANMLQELSVNGGNPIVRYAYEISRWHHERWDGSGYPDGLKGDDIPISAQIVAIADVYDALTSKRVYKPAFSHGEAMKMILSGQCGAFNPLLLECLSEDFGGIRQALAASGAETAAEDIKRRLGPLPSARQAASDRTLKLLDYERMKFNFFAELSEEIQFEYTAADDLFKLSPWGAKKLGVPQEVVNPAADPALKEAFGVSGWFKKFESLIQKTSPASPEFKHECELPIGGARRWYNIFIRVFYSDAGAAEGVIGKIMDVHDTHLAMSELKEKSIRDPLTGLLNREGAAEELKHKFNNFPAHKYAVAVFDVDKFKNVNDENGHMFGDRVLKEVSERLVHGTRVHDVCARIGGDEFLIVFDYVTELRPIIARVFKTICGEVDGCEVTVSMGVAEMTESGQTYEELFKLADAALYAAKEAGRGAYVFASDIKNIVPHGGQTEGGE